MDSGMSAARVISRVHVLAYLGTRNDHLSVFLPSFRPDARKMCDVVGQPGVLRCGEHRGAERSCNGPHSRILLLLWFARKGSPQDYEILMRIAHRTLGYNLDEIPIARHLSQI